MKKELENKLYDLTQRAEEVMTCGEIDIQIVINEVFGVESINLYDESVCLSFCDTLMNDFPLSALSDEVVAEILDTLETEIEHEENELDKVLDRIAWANV